MEDGKVSFSKGRMGSLERRLRMLEETNDFLWKEKSTAEDILESAITLGSFDTSLNRLDDPGPILEEIVARARTILPFKAAAVYLVSEDSSFAQAICVPPGHAAEIEEIVSRRIEDRTFAWALKRRKPILSGLSGPEPLHLLHALSTISRTRGMFVGILGEEWQQLPEYSLALLSVLLSASAGALESFELYRNLRSLNRDLADRMSQLEESRRELEEYRKFLEQQVERRTMELSRANEEMKMEIAERMRTEEDLRSSEEMLRLAVEGMGDGVWIWNGTTGKTDLSPLSAEILCGDDEDPASCILESTSGEAWGRIIHEDDRERLSRKKARCLSGEVPAYSAEYRVVGKDGKERWILERGRVVRKDREGRPLAIAGTHSDITGRKKLEDHIRFQATHDFLTGLPNRFLFEDRLTQVLARAKRQKGKAALFFVDMDDFKKVNDRYGHLAGDTLLKEAGSRIVACVREMDTVCRLGGDEFTVILPAVAGPGEAESIAGRIMDAFREPFLLGGDTIFLSLSVGIGIYPDHGNTVEQLLANADEAMYRAKGQGKRICFLSPRNTSSS
jgi:diguanylate cyclase (GGDEF)-like protein